MFFFCKQNNENKKENVKYIGLFSDRVTLCFMFFIQRKKK